MSNDKFETAMKGLEDAVSRLESGELSLEESLKAFEAGMKHAVTCSKKLDEAERRVEQLVRLRDGSFAREPFPAPAAEEKRGE
jgi:exodeoxyribonuclease VII small subunit